jgi:hypothetical protein
MKREAILVNRNLLQHKKYYKCRIKNQLDATYYFIVLLIGLTYFGHYCAHHHELATMMLITTLVVSFLVCCMLEVRCGLVRVVSGLTRALACFTSTGFKYVF